MILGGGVAAGYLFTFVVASHGHVSDCIAVLFLLQIAGEMKTLM